MSPRPEATPAKLLHESKNAAGARAKAAARADDHRLASDWGNLALAIDAALRRAVELMSR